MAKTPYQRHQEEEIQRAAEELKRIIDKPTLEPNEIWEITPENFIQWRKKHDYPRILTGIVLIIYYAVCIALPPLSYSNIIHTPY